MKHPITDREREYGIVTIALLPGMAERFGEWLEDRGFWLSPPINPHADADCEDRDCEDDNFRIVCVPRQFLET